MEAMELFLLDSNMDAVGIIDDYISIVWTPRRYNEAGDFEMVVPASAEKINDLQLGRYLYSTDDNDVLMVIETVEIETDIEDGDKLKVTGRSIESVLDRRIIWSQTILSGNLQNGVKKLLTDAIINPSIADRRISNFIFEDSTDSRITGLTLDAQFTGDDLYEAISGICKQVKIGFKISVDLDTKTLTFKLYVGDDRSYNQDTYPFVIFSPKFDNIISTDYLESTTTLKTVTLVAGEGEGSARKTTIVESSEGAGSGLDRREMFSDRRDLSTTTQSGTLSNAEYMKQLTTAGEEDLAENKKTKAFEGEVESTVMFKYGVDFFIGDIVQIENQYGMEGTARVIEVVKSYDTSGYTCLPTFEAINE